MKVMLLLVAAAMALAQESPMECSRAGPQDGHSMLSSLLHIAGYSDTCVAGCLDSCSSAMDAGHFTSLIAVRVTPPSLKGQALIFIIS